MTHIPRFYGQNLVKNGEGVKYIIPETSIIQFDTDGLHHTIARFLFDNIDRIGLIVDTHRAERRRIVDETKVDEPDK